MFFRPLCLCSVTNGLSNITGKKDKGDTKFRVYVSEISVKRNFAGAKIRACEISGKKNFADTVNNANRLNLIRTLKVPYVRSPRLPGLFITTVVDNDLLRGETEYP